MKIYILYQHAQYVAWQRSGDRPLPKTAWWILCAIGTGARQSYRYTSLITVGNPWLDGNHSSVGWLVGWHNMACKYLFSIYTRTSLQLSIVDCSRCEAYTHYPFECTCLVAMTCDRRHGHNELDDPMITQPITYSHIKTHPTTLEVSGWLSSGPTICTDSLSMESEGGIQWSMLARCWSGAS